MRFYLVDRITDVTPGERIAALKLVSSLDPVVEPHPLHGPCLVPPLVIESLAQTAAWLVIVSTDFARRGILGTFRTITFGRPARVGECLDLSAEVRSWNDDSVVFQWEASHHGEMVARVDDALCLWIDADVLEDPAETRRLYEALRQEAGPEECPPGDRLVPDPPATWWAPWDWRQRAPEEGRLVAARSVSMTDPVFVTHFPRFPTLPGVLMMQSLFRLGREALETASPGVTWDVASVQGTRFARYVRPGDRLSLQVRLGEHSEREATLSGEATVAGQRTMSMRRVRFVGRAG